jgi:hypothetical protein
VTRGSQSGRPIALLRWLSIVLRGIHLATVIGLGAALLGADLAVKDQATGVLISGAGMLLLDLRRRPQMLYEWSGLSLAIKLLAVAWLTTHSSAQLLFWSIVVWSVLFAHAPGAFRHARWWPRRV